MTLNLRVKRLIDDFKRVSGIDSALAWWNFYEGAAARQALSNWLVCELLEALSTKVSDHARDRIIRDVDSWLAKNGRRLEGHPDYEALSQAEKRRVALLGQYMPEAVIIPVETVRSVLGWEPKEFERSERLERSLRIPLAALPNYPALFQKTLENLYRVLDHPLFYDFGFDQIFGIYEPETIILEEWIYERVVGKMPRKGRQGTVCRLTRGWRRRMKLITVTLGDGEPPF